MDAKTRLISAWWASINSETPTTLRRVMAFTEKVSLNTLHITVKWAQSRPITSKSSMTKCWGQLLRFFTRSTSNTFPSFPAASRFVMNSFRIKTIKSKLKGRKKLKAPPRVAKLTCLLQARCLSCNSCILITLSTVSTAYWTRSSNPTLHWILAWTALLTQIRPMVKGGAHKRRQVLYRCNQSSKIACCTLNLIHLPRSISVKTSMAHK